MSPALIFLAGEEDPYILYAYQDVHGEVGSYPVVVVGEREKGFSLRVNADGLQGKITHYRHHERVIFDDGRVVKAITHEDALLLPYRSYVHREQR